MITPREFVDRWAQSSLREQQAAQSHFNELCELVSHKTPTQLDPEGKFFTFEEQVKTATGGKGRADVWYKGHFAWEYKGKHKDLDAAYAQLLSYKGGLDNPPLLVVCDFLEYRIYPQWPNTSGLPFVFKNEDLLDNKTRRFITWLLESPDKFLELRQTELEQREKLTLELAYKFAHLADLMRRHRDENGEVAWQPIQIARFLTKLVFGLFAEDIGLMPLPFGQPAFRYITVGAHETPSAFVRVLRELFMGMDGQMQDFIMKPVPYFNGGLFADSSPGANDGLEVLDLTQIPGGINILGEVSEADWRFVNPTIFGTLFEGALDENKRAQLGAHYTSESDIRLLIEPVLMQPLYRQWDDIRAEAEPLLQIYLENATPKSVSGAKDQLTALHDRMMGAIENTRVLDPACGSGNFLYMSLRSLKDLEGRVRKFFEPLGLPFRDVVTPRQLYGIEKDQFAAKLAQVVVWIGYLQWRYEDEGILYPILPTKNPHPRALSHPIMRDKLSPDEPDRIVCDDAVLRYDANGQPYEPEWPSVDVIVGNPPFLGGKWMQGELGEHYKSHLWQLYDSRVNRTADLVSYWFEKARIAIAQRSAKRVGLLATNTIRHGFSADVLKRIKETGDFFLAYTDHPWMLDGAALRISLIGFDDGSETLRVLNGQPVEAINADLTSGISLDNALSLPENSGICFRSGEKNGPFEISSALAQSMLNHTNKSGAVNADVVRPYMNAMDLVQRSRQKWIIDFADRTLEQAEEYETPIKYVKKHVKPLRDSNNRQRRRENWWQHGEIMPGMRRAIAPLKRFFVTPLVSKHRIFVWLKSEIFPDVRLIVFARDDDYSFGVLHSYIHELWSLRQSASHGIGNDPVYNKNTTFETFPLPYVPGQESQETASYLAISAAATQLHEERDAWLNPPDLISLGADGNGKTLRDRTLTHLYNALEAHRNNGEGAVNGGRDNAASAFAQRLAQLHDALDQAVFTAYGWEDLWEGRRTLSGDEALLQRLLTLNQERGK